MQHPRTLKALVLAVALGLPLQARAQAPFLVPIPASILVAPLVMLLIPLGMELSKSDEKRVQELEARGDWASIAAMATQHLGAKPGDLYWLELRGRALQRQSGCAAALPDLRQAFDERLAQAPLQPEPTFAAGLSLGLCEMAVWDLNAAAATMVRLSPLAPQRWEPIYNLGVIRALQGDLDGARAAEAALRPRNAEMADALLSRYIVPGSVSPAPDTAAGLSAQALPERLPPARAEQDGVVQRHAPAIYRHDLAGHIAGGIAGQPGHHIGNLRRLAEPLHGGAAHDFLTGVITGQHGLGSQLGGDGAGATAFTRMFLSASARAITRVSWFTPPLLTL
jgi:hypothetical protein